MKKKIKKQFEEHKIIYFCLFLVLLLFTAGFFYNRYAVDTYYLEGYGYRNNALYPYLRDGRVLMTLFLGILGKLHLSFAIAKKLSYLLAFFSLYLSILIFYHIFFTHYKKSKFLSAFLSFFFVLNIFIVEFFMFPEYTGIMCFSIFLISMATRMLITYFQSRKKKYVFYAAIFSFFTAFCYQGTLSLLVLFPIVFTLYYGKNIKNFIQNNLAIAFCYLVPSVSTLVLSKLLGSSRSSNHFNLSLTFHKIYEGAKDLLGSTFGILPPYFFLIFAMFFVAVVLYLLIRQRAKIFSYLFFIYVMAAVVIVTFIPHFLIKVESIWLIPRSNVGLGLIVGMPFVIYYLYLEKTKGSTWLFVFLFSILALFQFQGWQHLLFDQIKVNAFDRQEALAIVREIRSYEEDNEMIQKISLYKNKNTQYYYDGVVPQGDMNVRALATDWAASSLVSTYLNRALTQVEFSTKMNQRCAKKLEKDKTIVFFEDDTAYLCSY